MQTRTRFVHTYEYCQKKKKSVHNNVQVQVMSSNTLRKLTPELYEIAQKDCNENSETINSNIEALKVWIRQCPHLKARTDEQLLLSFLRRCKFSLEETKKRIDGFYAIRNDFPEVMGDRTVNDSILELYRTGVHIIPSKPVNMTGPRLIISQYCRYNPKQHHPRDVFKLFFMLLEMLAIEDDNTSVSGLAIVIDGRDVTTEQMLQFDPFLLKKCWLLVEHCFPMKFAEVHFLNIRRETQEIFRFIINLLPKRMPFKFIVHKKAEDLYDHVPRDAMTIEYGGHNGYQAEALAEWEKRLQDYTSYFANDVNYGTNEKLRLGTVSSWQKNELTGLSGSFRKLEID